MAEIDSESARMLELFKSKYPEQYEELETHTASTLQAPSESTFNLEVTVGNLTCVPYTMSNLSLSYITIFCRPFPQMQTIDNYAALASNNQS